ncbi:MAG: hypothetical protein ACREOO_18395 [bacterium]
MKTKIGTLIEEDIVRMLKERAARDNRSISDVIQDALLHYFQMGTKRRDIRLAAVERLCSRPFDLTSHELQEIMDEPQ